MTASVRSHDYPPAKIICLKNHFHVCVESGVFSKSADSADSIINVVSMYASNKVVADE